MSTVQYEKLEPLVSFVERVSSQDDIFSLRDEALAAKHTITFFNPLIEKHIVLINSLLEKPDLSVDQQKKLSALQLSLTNIGNQLNAALRQVAYIVKNATEIEDLKVSRLDGVQLLHAIRQIPLIISDALENLLFEVLRDVERVISENVSAEQYVKIVQQCPYFGKTSQFSVTSRIGAVLEEVNGKLEMVSIVEGRENKIEASNSGVEESRVAGMLATVPTYGGNGDE